MSFIGTVTPSSGKTNYPDFSALQGSELIASLWAKNDIQFLESYKELRFSDAIADSVDATFLEKVFLHSPGFDFEQVDEFAFGRYRNLGSEALELLSKHCPKIFEMEFNPCLQPLGTSQYCDHAFLVARSYDDALKGVGVKIPINRWLINKYCSTPRDQWEDPEIERSDLTPLIITEEIEPEHIQACINHLIGVADIIVEENLENLTRLIHAAEHLGAKSLLSTCDQAFSAIVQRESEGKTHEELLKFAQDMRNACDILHSGPKGLPKTRAALNKIAAGLFRKKLNEKMTISKDVCEISNVEAYRYYSSLFQTSAAIAKELQASKVLSDCPLFELTHDLNIWKNWIFYGRSSETRESYEQLLETWLECNPHNLAARELMGTCDIWNPAETKNEKAVKHLEILVRFDSNNHLAVCSLAQHLHAAGNQERAINLLEMAIANKPTDPLVYITLAHLLRKMGEKEKAANLLKPFQDKTKDYSELLDRPGKNKAGFIQLYLLYHQALDGALVTPEDLPEWLRPDFPDVRIFFQLLRKALLRSEFPVSILNANIQVEREITEIGAYFFAQFPLLKDLVKQLLARKENQNPQDLEMIVDKMLGFTQAGFFDLL